MKNLQSRLYQRQVFTISLFGQKLSVDVKPAKNFILEVYEVNSGDVLLSTQSGSSSFEVVLPELGDYMVNVINQTNEPQDFSLSVKVR
jgi:hypothetical protein